MCYVGVVVVAVIIDVVIAVVIVAVRVVDVTFTIVIVAVIIGWQSGGMGQYLLTIEVPQLAGGRRRTARARGAAPAPALPRSQHAARAPAAAATQTTEPVIPLLMIWSCAAQPEATLASPPARPSAC